MNAPASRSRTAIAIRPAIESDCERVADIYNDAIRSGRSTMDTRFVDAAHLEQLLAKCTPREVLLVGESRSRVVGWGIVKRYSERPGYDYACEESVYVADDQQGRGYGSALLEVALKRAHGFGYRHVVAKILAVNESSVRFHERFGFEIVGRQREIGLLQGEWHDVVIMQRIFPDIEPR